MLAFAKLLTIKPEENISFSLLFTFYFKLNVYQCLTE